MKQNLVIVALTVVACLGMMSFLSACTITQSQAQHIITGK